jgi:putative hydrolase of the HAD superfamily
MQSCAYFFDLDDTLVDTYQHLVSQAHWDAAKAMVAAGFPYPLEETYRYRLQFHQKDPRHSQEFLFTQHFPEAMNKHIETASYQGYFHRKIPQDLKPFPETIPLLDFLQTQQKPLFLITSGIEETQKEKVTLLRIAPFFKEISYLSSSSSTAKYLEFSRLLNTYQLPASQVICIGNRLDSEIEAGNLLGCYTLYLKQGEFAHLQVQKKSERPQIELQSLADLASQLPLWEKQGFPPPS